MRIFFTIALLCIAFTGIYAWWYIANNVPAPSDFPMNVPIEITSGSSISAIATQLEAQKVVSSGTLLYFILLWQYDPTDVKASVYIFDTPLNVTSVAKRLTEGDFDSNLITFTHVEGERVTEIANNAARVLPNVSVAEFVSTATPLEGTLFPETYRVPVTYSTQELITLMQNMYEQVLSPLRPAIASSSLTEREVIILASIIEREANTPESMKMVSGILQNRLAIDMPLQADASIEYVLDKPLKELLPEDLKINSPYNTYTNKGLPPTPIGNPGKAAIEAVLYPTQSEYLFYITDPDGTFHYAKTFNEHRTNIENHLR
jgi:UPF0755 protein